MKYIAILDTDEFKDFKFFEDADGKYLAVKDANSESNEWLPLHFEALDISVRQLIVEGAPLEKHDAELLDKIRDEIEELDRYYDNDYFSANNCPMYKCDEVLQIIDKYKAKSKVEALEQPCEDLISKEEEREI